MNRDMDLVRRIILAAADQPLEKPMNGLPDVAEPVFAAHAQWLHEAGLVVAALSPKESLRPANHAIVWRLTWAGCDFADSIRSDTLWAKAKTTVLKPSASWTFGVLVDWLKGQITDQLTGLTS